ncbi:MAG TPA: hypothetical protein PLS29_03930 [Acidimicrobiales bacterium]|nr:hypothetical protein [Acidimicrobiales bacterium]
MKAPPVSKLLVGAALAGAVGLVAAGAGASVTPPSTPAALPGALAKPHAVAFRAAYHGTMSLLWSSSSVKVTSLVGTGTIPGVGASTLRGTGISSPSSTCDPFSGTGSITTAKGALVLRVVSSAKQSACAAGSAAPTTVTVKGVATVVTGRGIYLAAKGTLAISGTFSIQSTAAGSKESDQFTATLVGKLTVK